MSDEINRSPLWIGLLVLGVLGAATTGLAVDSTSPLGVLAALPLAIGGVYGMMAATGNIRPYSSLMAVAFFLGVGILVVAVNHSQSTWYAVSSQNEVCEIVDLDTHRGRYTTYYKHDVACRDGLLTYETKTGFAGEIGDQLPLITDPAGLQAPVRADDISAAKAWWLPISVLLGLAFVVLVVAKPRKLWEPINRER